MRYDLPFVFDGYLDVDGDKVKVTRIHLEEDTGKSFHPKGADHTLIDFNRAGAPLLELVTEPTIHSAAESKKFDIIGTIEDKNCPEIGKDLEHVGVKISSEFPPCRN